jgi:transcriptional regulator with XRE-family HTH domain
VSIKQRVLDLCKERNVRVGTLERETGMSNGTIRQWKDDTHPNGKTISRIADYFGVSADSILLGEQKEKPGISTELSYTHYILIDRINQMSEAEAEAFLRTLDAFQAMQRTLTTHQP